MAMQVADVEGYMKELQASLDLKKMQIEKNKQHKSDFENLLGGLRMLTKKTTMQIEPERTPIEQEKEFVESHNAEMQMTMWNLYGIWPNKKLKTLHPSFERKL
ncbi:hypothetical protein L6452_19246 [Arctium lappa]|uniref:Uncharacterized protein n=1 Tax=Arctium lappa TaxID=4217 RepID=A0ACB9B7C0_ARCLA|nr:hypothetical protein L6452_19246 [Arctium lappa]